ncbi:activator-dependent family glycosyltransferase [Spirillospora sp. NPDC047279]|uniref:activator-dependent family glycosyltransferase n=1 Tax=Spirillospora sp. NPDC047279 TaxID=3155478 RepID=UPI0033FCC2CD
MRVLFTTFAAKSHTQAQVPMAWALHTAGHEVVVASQPDVADDITSAGLTAVPVGEELNLGEQHVAPSEDAEEQAQQEEMEDAANDMLDMSESRPEKLTWDYMLGVFTGMTAFGFQNECPESMVDDLTAFARDWKPDLVIWDTLTFAGSVAARACGAAHARFLFGLDDVARMRASFLKVLRTRPPELRDDPLAEWLEWTAGRFGVDFDEELVTGQWTIDPIPTWMRLPVPDVHYVPVRYVPYNGKALMPDWLHEQPKRRRVAVSLGLGTREVLRRPGEIVLEDLFEAVADLDVEVVATLDASQLESVKNVPENVRTVDFVPLNALLPTCSAIITHGGSGTVSTALENGVPQLIVPAKIWDAKERARKLEERGAGLCLTEDKGLTAGDLRTHLTRVLDDPSFTESACRLRQEQAGTPTPNDIVPVLEKLTAEHRAARR